jgi:hypothetical protein
LIEDNGCSSVARISRQIKDGAVHGVVYLSSSVQDGLVGIKMQVMAERCIDRTSMNPPFVTNDGVVALRAQRFNGRQDILRNDMMNEIVVTQRGR